MKSVVHISTYDKSGGAAIAAWRLHQGMQRLGVESRMVSRRRSWPGPDVSCISSDLFDAVDEFTRRRIRPTQPPGATLFSLAQTSIPLLEHPWIAAADIIHLHWVAQFISPEDIEALCQAGKTVFWSFHDQWAYTGGCHYIGGTRRLIEDWEGTSQISDPGLHPLLRLELLRKKRLFASWPVHVIAPSQWMAREAAASGVVAPEMIHVVPYGLDLGVFHSDNASDNAVAAADSMDAINLLFGCQNLTEHRKGYQELRAALVLCMSDPRFAAAALDGRIRLQTFGAIPNEEMDLPIPLTNFGTINGETEIAGMLRHASAFLCPTLDDNLPNVVMESLACGCPVLGFATGGVPDMVTHDKNGLLAPQGDVPELARRLMDFCLDSGLRSRLRKGALATDLTHWSLEAQARRMLALYDAASPGHASLDEGRMPEAPALLELDGQIVSHFSTEMTRLLFRENLAQKVEAEGHYRSQRQRIDQTENRVVQLKERIEIEVATRKDLQVKLRETKETLKHEMREALKEEGRIKQDLKAKLAASKAEIQDLKQQILKNRTLFQRIWRGLRRKWKRSRGTGA